MHIYATYDKYADFFFGLLTFENHELAYASLRRMIRDMYHKGDISYDELCDTKFVYIADFDDKSGEIKPVGSDSYIYINANDFVDGECVGS